MKLGAGRQPGQAVGRRRGAGRGRPVLGAPGGRGAAFRQAFEAVFLFLWFLISGAERRGRGEARPPSASGGH